MVGRISLLNGGDFLSKDNKEFVMNSKEGIEAMQYCADLINKYKVSPDGKSTTAMSADQMFNTGADLLLLVEEDGWFRMIPS